MTTNGTNGHKPKKRLGRVPKLLTDPGTIDRIAQAIRVGMPIERAAAIGGICEKTFYTWRENGHEALAKQANGLPITAYEKAYIAFLDALAAVEREAEEALAQRLVDAAMPHPVRTTTLKRTVLREGNRIVRNAATGDPIFVDETTVTERIEYDWRAAREVLRARWRERWGNEVQVTGQVELTMPPQDGDAEAIAQLEAAYREAGLLPALPASEESA